MNTLVIVPVYNEEETLQKVISDLKVFGFDQILIINDGSGDNSANIAKKEEVVVLTHILNRGLGASLGTGFAYARKSGAKFVATFDADGQHRAVDLLAVAKPVWAGKCDVAIGDRMRRWREMPLDRMVLNFLANILTYFLYGSYFGDSQSGLRVFNRKAVEKIQIKTNRMEVSSEILWEIRKNKLKLLPVSIKPIYTDYSLGKGQDGRGNWNAVRIGIRMFLRMFR